MDCEGKEGAKLNLLQKHLLPPDVRKFVEAGMLDEQLRLTQAVGVKAVQRVVFETHRKRFEEIADEILAERKGREG